MFEEYQNDGWTTGILEYPYGRGVNFEMQVKDIDSIIRALQKAEIPLFRELKKRIRKSSADRNTRLKEGISQ